MKTITIHLTDTEDTVFNLIAANPTEWVANAAKERCRVAIDEIVNLVVQKCLQDQIQIPASREEMVALAVSKEWVSKPQVVVHQTLA